MQLISCLTKSSFESTVLPAFVKIISDGTDPVFLSLSSSLCHIMVHTGKNQSHGMWKGRGGGG